MAMQNMVKAMVMAMAVILILKDLTKPKSKSNYIIGRTLAFSRFFKKKVNYDFS